MGKDIIINTGVDETRIALLENGVLVELYIERKRDRGIVGNIYKGTVTRVLPGIQAAFVDVGLERDVFLYVMDVHDNINEFERLLGGQDDEVVDYVCTDGGSDRTLSSRFQKNPSEARGHGQHPTSPCREDIWSSCPPSTMSEFPKE